MNSKGYVDFELLKQIVLKISYFTSTKRMETFQSSKVQDSSKLTKELKESSILNNNKQEIQLEVRAFYE